MSTTSFSTSQGTPASVAVYLNSDVTGATVTVEFGSAKFNPIALSKGVTVTGGRLATIALTAAEVDTLKDVHYRVKAVKGGNTSYVAEGTVSYVRSKLPQAVKVGTGTNLYSGSGVPANTLGVAGDFYFRTDATGTANQRLYIRGASAWTGIL